MRIITLKEEEFNEFAKKHKYESFYQTSNYANLEALNGYSIHYLGFTQSNGTLIGATLLLYKKLFWNYKYAYAPRGMLIDYDDPYLLDNITNSLKNLLKKQKFVFIKINPPVIATERDYTGKITYFSNTVNEIVVNLKKNDYIHQGFNIYFESKLPRWNTFVKLLPNENEMFNSFTDDTKNNIKESLKKGLKIVEDKEKNIENLYQYSKKAGIKKKKSYFEKICNAYQDKLKIYYAIIDSNVFSKNINKLYNNELEINTGLTNIIENNQSGKYNMEKVIHDKMISDKKLNNYKKDIIDSTKLLRQNPDGLVCGMYLIIEQEKGANIYMQYNDPEFDTFRINETSIFEIMKIYSRKKFMYLNIGAITGNFNKENEYYYLLETKLGFNPSIIEYIGEFDLVINSFIYKIYKNKKTSK